MNRSEPDREHLTRAMLALDHGLRQVAARYGEHVSLADEDPETFGAGHFVLYPAQHTRARFAVEEQYAAGTDWSDPDRLPTSWLWRAERLVSGTDGRYVWGLERHGETFPENLTPLLTEAEMWARRVQNRAGQSAQFGVPSEVRRQPPAPRL